MQGKVTRGGAGEREKKNKLELRNLGFDRGERLGVLQSKVDNERIIRAAFPFSWKASSHTTALPSFLSFFLLSAVFSVFPFHRL